MNATAIIRCFAIAAAAFTVAATTAPAALAQDHATPLTRAEVKHETLAAMQAGQLLRAGEGTPTSPHDAVSTKSRHERKAETLVARSRNELVHGGIATYRASISQQSAKSIKTRAERKAETMDAVRNGQMLRAGDA